VVHTVWPTFWVGVMFVSWVGLIGFVIVYFWLDTAPPLGRKVTYLIVGVSLAANAVGSVMSAVSFYVGPYSTFLEWTNWVTHGALVAVLLASLFPLRRRLQRSKHTATLNALGQIVLLRSMIRAMPAEAFTMPRGMPLFGLDTVGPMRIVGFYFLLIPHYEPKFHYDIVRMRVRR
jgi:ABC-type multidrug transport system permease subunit